MTYRKQLENWIEQEQKKGLKDIDVFINPDVKSFNEEDFCEEFLRMVNASDVPDPEVLGKYSL